jgi:adenylate cyclase
VRITAQLIDALNGTHLWADRFDGSLEDVFDLQDKVASSVGGVIEPALQAAETARSAQRPTTDLTAYDLYLRAHEMALSSGTRIPAALVLLERAIERDPNYGPALALAAVLLSRLIGDGRSENLESDVLQGTHLARRALRVAGDDPNIIANAAMALAMFGEDIGTMIALVDRALTLNPSFARGWYISGFIRLWAGHPDVAMQHAEVSLRLNPRARIGTIHTVIGAAYFASGRFEDAIPNLLLGIEEAPNFPTPYRYLAASYGHTGRREEARDVIKSLREITSAVMPPIMFLRNPKQRELLLSGLRVAVGEAT